MELELLLFLSLVFLLMLYVVIKTAVSKGIDSSVEIKNLKYEIRELKKQQNSEVEKSHHYINTKA